MGLFRAAGRHEELPLGGYCVLVNAKAEESLVPRIKAMQWLAAGAKYINFYTYGPSYSQVGTWSDNHALLPLVADIGKQIAAIDSVLGNMRKRPASVGVLYNRTAGIWADFADNTEQDARYIYWALEDAGYHVDFIPEEDIEAGRLSSYRVLYVNGVQLKKAAAEKIAAWTDKGGVLVGTAGAGTRDEFNRPMKTLNKVFGIKDSTLELKSMAGRPFFETRSMPVIDRMATHADERIPKVDFNRLGMLETLVPETGGTIFMNSQEGAPTGVFRKYGDGTSVRFAALPGIAYVNEAIRVRDVPVILPRGYRRELRDLIAWPATIANAEVMAEMSSPKATVARWDGNGNSNLYVIDYSGDPIRDFSLTIPDGGNFSEARSARGFPVQMSPTEEGALRLTFDLEGADAIILKHNPS